MWTLETLMLRTHLQFEDQKAGRLDYLLWMNFVSADIELFHIVCRSIFDYITSLMFTTADSPARFRTRKPSFDKLRNSLRKSAPLRSALGPQWSSLVTACDWFAILRAVRNGILHQGALTMVGDIGGTISFQVSTHGRTMLEISELMLDKTSVDLIAYGGMVYAYLLLFLEDIAKVAFERLPNVRRLSATLSHPPYGVVPEWIRRAQEKVGGS
jgi:hypothetical protein